MKDICIQIRALNGDLSYEYFDTELEAQRAFDRITSLLGADGCRRLKPGYSEHKPEQGLRHGSVQLRVKRKKEIFIRRELFIIP